MDFESLSQTCDLFLKFAKKKGKKKGKKPWADKPEGWTGKSVKQYSKTMMKGKKHPFTIWRGKAPHFSGEMRAPH